jgi:RNA polymerase sigma factor (sigma-70 family)
LPLNGREAAVRRREMHYHSLNGTIMPEPESSITNASLLLRLGHHPSDQAAWEEFVNRYGAKIYSWCRAWRLQDADARDVTQAVLAKLAVRLRGFAYNPEQKFRGWLRTLVKNACRDCMAERRRTIGAVARGVAGQADLIQTVEARDDLARRLEAEFDLELLEEAERRVRQRAAPQTWEAYRLTAIEGLSGADAAARLGMKVAAVFVSRSHVIKRLQSEVRALEDHPEASPAE